MVAIVVATANYVVYHNAKGVWQYSGQWVIVRVFYYLFYILPFIGINPNGVFVVN